MISTIIFDADGTLYTTRTSKAYDRMIASLSSEIDNDPKTIRKHWEDRLAELKDSKYPAERHRATPIERALNDLGVDKLERGQLTKNALEAFWEQAVADIVGDPALPDLFDTLEQQGIDKKFVASDEFRIPLEKKLREVEPYWNNRFDEIVTPETVDAMKPSPAFVQYILDSYDIEPGECLFVGDSWERDLAAAAEAGMKTVLKTEKADERPDHCIETLDELPPFIESHR